MQVNEQQHDCDLTAPDPGQQVQMVEDLESELHSTEISPPESPMDVFKSISQSQESESNNGIQSGVTLTLIYYIEPSEFRRQNISINYS